MSNVLDTLIGRVHESDPALANAISAEIKKLQNRREYGLVYEAHAPEGVRLWGKKILAGDIVNVLPPRGVMETKDNSLEWKVVSINRKENTAHVIRKVDDNAYDEKDVSVDDLVAYADFRQTIYPGLVEVDRVERGEMDDPYHVVINGENFHALQAMLWCYAGKVDCIYIDPPYNTGAKDWKYNNDYVDGNDQYKHSKWLSFMEQRLKLAKKLLNPKDSVLIVTIDEKEYLRLGMLLEQMFPEARIQMISSVISSKGSARKKSFFRTNEFLFLVMFGDSEPNPLELSNEWFTGDFDNTKRNRYRWVPLLRTGNKKERVNSPGCFYPVYISNDGSSIVEIGDALPLDVDKSSIPSKDGCITLFPIHTDGTEGRWAYQVDGAKKLLNNGYLRVSKKQDKESGFTLSYLPSGLQQKIQNNEIVINGHNKDGSVIFDSSDYQMQIVPGTQWRLKSHDSTEYGTKLNQCFLPDRKFPFPKSVYAVEDVLRFFVTNKPNALIVDFFAGSGTTAHATMLLNHLDGGHRRTILVTNNEIGPDTENEFIIKKHLRPTDTEWQKYGIAKYITWERVKAALTGINTKGEPIKGDYKFTEEFPMSEGFKENVVFFDLKYEDGKAIRLNMAFKEIAPLLWMKAGSKGRMIQVISPQGYDVSEQYAILFDFLAAKDFIKAVKDSGIKVAYIVTDSEPLYQQIYKQLPKGIEPVRLYENYLTSFSIYGAV